MYFGDGPDKHQVCSVFLSLIREFGVSLWMVKQSSQKPFPLFYTDLFHEVLLSWLFFSKSNLYPRSLKVREQLCFTNTIDRVHIVPVITCKTPEL